MSHEIQIYLNSYDYCYCPGLTVNGRVECNFSSERKLKAIAVRFEGKCNTCWLVKEKQNDDAVTNVHYSGEEIYFNHEFNLMGSGHTEFTLPAGRHLYPFTYHLPEKLPSSYEDQFGWATVRYQIKARLDNPHKAGTEACAVLNVVSPLDLNQVTEINRPIDVWADTAICAWLCRKRGKISLSFSTPVRGYIAGQDIIIRARIQNFGVGVKKVKFKLIQLTEFIVKTPKKIVKQNEEIIAETNEGGATTNGEKSWTVVLPIPAHHPFPNMIASNLINIKYHLKGEVEIRGKRSNLIASMPLTIGHVPIREELLTTVTQPVPSAPIENPFIETISGSSLQVPPSYDEAIELRNIEKFK